MLFFFKFAYPQFTGYAEYIRFSHREHLKPIPPSTPIFTELKGNPSKTVAKRLQRRHFVIDLLKAAYVACFI